MEQIYSDLTNSGALASVDKLYKAVKHLKITKSAVRQFLTGKDSYTLLATRSNKYRKRKFIVSGPGVTLCLDMAYLHQYKKSNDNISHLLFAIDMYSRYLRVIPVKSLKSIHVIPVLKQLLEESIYEYKNIASDMGVEFFGKAPQKFFKDYGVHSYTTYNRDVKISIVERSIRTIKQKVVKYIIHNNTESYLQHLETFVDTYNTTPHRGLRFHTPLQIHLMSDAHKLIEFSKLLYKSSPAPKKRSFPNLISIGSHVRLKRLSASQFAFNKSTYLQNTREIFVVSDIVKTHNPVTYKIKDLNNEEISGVFYREELFLVKPIDKFAIEILKQRTRKNKKEYLVKYLNYPTSLPEWKKASELIKLD